MTENLFAALDTKSKKKSKVRFRCDRCVGRKVDKSVFRNQSSTRPDRESDALLAPTLPSVGTCACCLFYHE